MAKRRRRVMLDNIPHDRHGEETGKVTAYDPETGFGTVRTSSGNEYQFEDEQYRFPSVDDEGNLVARSHPDARMEPRFGDELMFRWYVNGGIRIAWWMLKDEHDDFKQALEAGQLFRMISVDPRKNSGDKGHTIVMWRGRTLDGLMHKVARHTSDPKDFPWEVKGGKYVRTLQRYDRPNNRWNDLPREALLDGTLPTFMVAQDELTAEVTAEVHR